MTNLDTGRERRMRREEKRRFVGRRRAEEGPREKRRGGHVSPTRVWEGEEEAT